MKTPIYDFARAYAESGTVRMHMPGHKGKSLLGFEYLDITEMTGADDLYNADGIIAESEGISPAEVRVSIEPKRAGDVPNLADELEKAIRS